MSNVIKAKRGPALNTGPHTIELCIRDFVLQPLVCHVCHTKSLLVGYASDQRQPNERFSVSQRRPCQSKYQLMGSDCRDMPWSLIMVRAPFTYGNKTSCCLALTQPKHEFA